MEHDNMNPAFIRAAATDFAVWAAYVRPGREISREQWAALPVAERMRAVFLMWRDWDNEEI